jgi:phosphotransferase family enzyme
MSSPIGQTVEGFTPDIAVRETNEIRERVACALTAKCSSISVRRCDRSPSRLAVRCTGRAGEKRFFAKIFLTKLYPIPRRFPLPWEDAENALAESRSVSKQIEIEWEMTHKVRAFSGGSVPAPLGRSREARTIVWEEASGIRMDRLATRPWRRSGERESAARGLYRAGQWLRSLHGSTLCSDETIDLNAGIRRLGAVLSICGGAERKYVSVAHCILQSLVDRLGASSVPVPVSLTHGDFCPANLLWDEEADSLAVVDFELADFRPASYDLFSVISHLRARLLNPLISERTIEEWESSFWRGYGEVSPELFLIVRSLALARIYYHHLPRLLTRGKRRGRIASFNALLYRAFFERILTARRFGFPPELVSPYPWASQNSFRGSAPKVANSQ